MKKEKQYTVKSPKGVEYTVNESKAKFLVENFKCTWVDDKPRAKKEPVKPKGDEA